MKRGQCQTCVREFRAARAWTTMDVTTFLDATCPHIVHQTNPRRIFSCFTAPDLPTGDTGESF